MKYNNVRGMLNTYLCHLDILKVLNYWYYYKGNRDVAI